MINNFDLIYGLVSQYEMPIFVCDKDFYISQVNKFISESALNITVGQHINDVLSNCSADYLSAFDKVLKGLPYFSTNFEFNFIDATLCMLPVMNKSEVECIMCILDISNKDKNNSLLSCSGPVSPHISERYRAPVAGIMNVSAILARRFQADEDYKCLEYLNHITHCCYLMLNTSVSVQEYYMLVNDKREFNMKKLVFNRFLENICRALQVLFSDTGFILEFVDNSKEKIITEIDENLISLAIFQIISNSCKYSAKGSTIKVSLTQNNNTISIIVTDEGIGIDSSIISRVFDPFFSFNPTPVTEDEIGIGLGLPIAKKIIEGHGGQVFITSEVNKGTRIVISIPVKSNDLTPLTLNSDTTKYITDKFSNIYLIFAAICDIKLY